jgi:hypothetical protein
VLVLTRGEPTSIEVVNRSGEPTAVHWHGIELESYYDGVAGWSGTPGARPAIRPASASRCASRRSARDVHVPHAHDELRQQYGGLVGALVVLEPGSDGTRRATSCPALRRRPQRVYINGSLAPAPMELEVGRTYRLRIADIAVFRQLLRVRLVRDSALLAWRPIAKDGSRCRRRRPTARPSVVNLPSGETRTSSSRRPAGRAGAGGLERPGGGSGGNPMLHGRLPFRVSPAAGGSGASRSSSSRARPRL